MTEPYSVDAAELAIATEGATGNGTVIAAYQGEAVPMSPDQFARLVSAADGCMVLGRQAVLRAIGAADGDDALPGAATSVDRVAPATGGAQ